MADNRNWTQVATVKGAQVSANAQLQPRRSTLVLSPATPVLHASICAATSSTSAPQRQRSLSLEGRQSVLSVSGQPEATQARRGSRLVSPRTRGLMAGTISQQIVEHAGIANSAATQPNAQFRASIPSVIRSPALGCQPSPTIVQNQFRSSTTALGTRRWSLCSPGTSPLLQPAAPPVVTASNATQGSVGIPQAAVVLRRSPLMTMATSPLMTMATSPLMKMLSQEASLPCSTRASPKIALLAQSPSLLPRTPPLQKLTPTLAKLQASPASVAATQPTRHLPAQHAAASGSPAEEDDLFFALPPPEVDLEDKNELDLTATGARWRSVDSEDGSDPGDLDGGSADPAQDNSLVRSPCGTRWVKASERYALDLSYSIWFQHATFAKKKAKSEQQYQEDLQSIGTFNSVQDFWRYWNAIDLKKMPNFCSLSVFKHPIKPMWEDPHNKEGGQWVIRCVDRTQTADFFTKLALGLIGGYFECHEDLCGVVLNMKPKFNSLSLWNCQVETDLVAPVSQELRELLGFESGDDSFVIEYKDHSGTIVTNAIKRKEVPSTEAAPRLTAEFSTLGGQPSRLAPTWLARPARAAGADATTAAPGAPTSGTGVAVASEMRATAAPFAFSGTTGYSGYQASASTDGQYAQGHLANGGQYGNYYSGDYAYYGNGSGEYYPAGQAQNTSNEWA